MAHEKIAARALPRNALVSREGYILDACRGRRVLHVGCADAPFTAAKLEAGTLLHHRLREVCGRLAGIDVDADALDWLRAHGFDHLHLADAERLGEVAGRIGFEPEVIVAGEVLEHLAQPLDFLRALREVMGPGARAVLSVPNAYWALGFLHVLRGREKVHAEHVAYYSYHTVQALARRAGLGVEEILPYDEPMRGALARAARLLLSPVLRLRPHLAPGYVLKLVPAG